MSTLKPSRAARLIRIIAEVKTNPRQTVEDLLKKFAISKTQFYEDRQEIIRGLGFEFSYSRPKGMFEITEFELRVGARQSSQIEDVERLLAHLVILPLDSEAVRIAAREQQRLRELNQMIGFPDLLIAAIGLQYNLPLATFNREHFLRVSDMKLVDL